MSTLAVTLDDGTVLSGDLKMLDYARFEQHYGVVYEDGVHAEWAFYLAWLVFTRTKQEKRPFADFLDDVSDDVEVVVVPLEPSTES